MPHSPLLTDPTRLITGGSWQRPRASALTVDWTRAPRGLDTFVIFEGGQPIDVVRGRQFTLLTPITDGPTAIGTGLSYTQVDGGLTNACYTNVSPLFTTAQPSSFEAYFYWTQNSGVIVGMADGNPSAGATDRNLGIGNVTANAPTWYIFDGAANAVTGTALTPPLLVHLVGVADGSTTTLYVNGVQAASGAAANTGFTGYGTPVFCIGSHGSTDFNNTITANILHGGFATVAWSADEVMDRYLNMYSFLVPVENDLPVMLPPMLPMMGQIWI